MELTILIQGIIIGLSIAAVGIPIGILCIKHSLSEGFWAGIAIGIGAALADAIYSAIAAFGLSSICSFLLTYQFYLRISGGSYLLYLGYTTFRTIPDFSLKSPQATNPLNLIFTPFLLTLTSPVTILGFLTFFTNLNIGCITVMTALIITIGVFLGSMLWWLLLALLASVFKKRVHANILEKVNRAAGILIMFFGALILLRSLSPN